MVTQVQTDIGRVEQEVGRLRGAPGGERWGEVGVTTSSWGGDTTAQRKTLPEQLCREWTVAAAVSDSFTALVLRDVEITALKVIVRGTKIFG